MHLKAFLKPAMSYGWAGGPEFKTRIIQKANGSERRNADWAQPRQRFTTPFEHLSNEAHGEILRMVYACRAQLHAFLFRNDLDYSATDETFGVGDGVQEEWQLCRVSIAGSVVYERNIYALYSPDGNGGAVLAVPIIKVDGTPTAAITVDHDRGRVVFDTAPSPGAVLTWSGDYSLWVRFGQDWIPFNFDEPDGTYGSLEVVEVHPPESEAP